MALEQRDYQLRIVDKTIQTFLDGGKNVLIESPAGSGKTVMAFSTLNRIFEYSERLFNKKAEDVVFGWSALRRNLLVQAEAENQDKFKIPNVRYISMFDKNPPKVDVLVIDEAQHDAANSARHVYGICDPAIALGLSATPYRTDRMQLCFDRIIKDAGYHRLIQDGYLSKFDQYMMNEYSPESVTATYLSDRAKWGKCLMFFHRISECMEACKILQAAGVRCDVVTGTSDRFAQLDKFESGEYEVLLNVYVLTEGFDAPDMKTVFVRDSSKGPTIQMGGRVLRMHPEIPVVNIVQSTATHWPFVKTAKPNHQFIETDDHKWLSVGTNERIELIRKEMLKRIAKSDAVLPLFITSKSKSGKIAAKLKKLAEKIAKNAATESEELEVSEDSIDFEISI